MLFRSYSVAFIENAPIDALIQRFGRVNRAGKLEDAEGNKTLAPVYLYKEIVGKTPFYDEEILNKTWNELQSLDDEDLTENDLINVCNNVYKDGYSEQQSKDFEQGLHIELFNRNWVAADCDSDILDKLEMKNMKVDVLCSNLEEEYRELIEQKRYIEASELLVSVYQYTTQLKNREIGGNIVKKADGLCYNSNIGYHNITPSASEFI